jgi:hypothetical protein
MACFTAYNSAVAKRTAIIFVPSMPHTNVIRRVPAPCAAAAGAGRAHRWRAGALCCLPIAPLTRRLAGCVRANTLYTLHPGTHLLSPSASAPFPSLLGAWGGAADADADRANAPPVTRRAFFAIGVGAGLLAGLAPRARADDEFKKFLGYSLQPDLYLVSLGRAHRRGVPAAGAVHAAGAWPLPGASSLPGRACACFDGSWRAAGLRHRAR